MHVCERCFFGIYRMIDSGIFRLPNRTFSSDMGWTTWTWTSMGKKPFKYFSFDSNWFIYIDNDFFDDVRQSLQLDREESHVERWFVVSLEHHSIVDQLQLDRQKYDSIKKHTMNAIHFLRLVLLEENHETPFHNNQYENILVQNVVYLYPWYAHTIVIDLTKQ